MTQPCPQGEQINPPCRSFEELRSSGLLWAINKVLLHPRGFALAVHFPEGATREQIEAHEVELIGWGLAGDGREPWSFAPPADDEGFATFEEFLSEARRVAAPMEKTGPPADTGCPMPGCTDQTSHVHPAWTLAEAQGRLTPEVAATWNAGVWRLFLGAHGISQWEAMTAVRERAKAAGWPLPWSLDSLAGRPQLAAVLLTMATNR